MATPLPTVDFETEAIGPRPAAYPPRPVGVSVRMPGQRGHYFAFGHPEGNNCSLAEARAAVRRAYAAGAPVFHNSAFDLDVAEVWLGLRPPPRFEDTMYLAFLDDPRAQTLSLKPLAELHLGRAPRERDTLRDWILAHVPGATAKDWGAHIARAPGGVVGAYADADTEMTAKLAAKLGRRVGARGMLAAYDRELALTRVTLEMERGGIRVDRRRLARDGRIFARVQAEVEAAVFARLGTTFDLSSSAQLYAALTAAGKLGAVVKTAKGNPSTSAAALAASCTDPALLDLLRVRGVLEKYSNTFFTPWLARADADGYLHPSFHQVRARSEEGKGNGTRSGRYSSSDPNFQQVPAGVEESKNNKVLRLVAETLARAGLRFTGMRTYIVPDPDTVLVSLDYSQQELRILAHYEGGALAEAYRTNPDLDVHDFVRQRIREATGMDFPRKFVKTVAFGLLYGMGIDKLAAQLETERDTAAQVKSAFLKSLPGVRKVIDQLRELARAEKPLVTWGGRQYFCEPPAEVNGQMRTFEYKMLNYLIQGSAADCTKQGMLNVAEGCRHTRIAVQVHDELVCCVAREHAAEEIPRIRAALQAVDFGVPMVAGAEQSARSWGEVK